MNKAEAPCRPIASLKFTIDNILNLKTSCHSCHSSGQQDEAVPEPRPDPGSKLTQSGKKFGEFTLFLIIFFNPKCGETIVSIERPT